MNPLVSMMISGYMSPIAVARLGPEAVVAHKALYPAISGVSQRLLGFRVYGFFRVLRALRLGAPGSRFRITGSRCPPVPVRSMTSLVVSREASAGSRNDARDGLLLGSFLFGTGTSSTVGWLS
jgi:hypothetical protein